MMREMMMTTTTTTTTIIRRRRRTCYWCREMVHGSHSDGGKAKEPESGRSDAENLSDSSRPEVESVGINLIQLNTRVNKRRISCKWEREEKEGKEGNDGKEGRRMEGREGRRREGKERAVRRTEKRKRKEDKDEARIRMRRETGSRSKQEDKVRGRERDINLLTGTDLIEVSEEESFLRQFMKFSAEH